MIGNTRADPCSRILKREITRHWVADNCSTANTDIYLGIDWTEIHRFEGAAKRWAPWRVHAPMTEAPYLDKGASFDALAAAGIARPRLYELGFPHNNCGGFCIKAGQAHFRHLLRVLPDRYAEHEVAEQAMREHLGKDVAILRDRRGGTTKPMTLRVLRERLEADKNDCDLFEWGGCGCFSEAT